MMANLMDGTIKPEDYSAMLLGYAQIERRYRDILTAMSLAHKMGLPLNKGIAGQLVGNGKFKAPQKKPYNRTADRGK
jgi:hypothetical protein